MTLELGVMLEV